MTISSVSIRPLGLSARIRHRPGRVSIATRTYADRYTQAAFDAWNEGTKHVARRIARASQVNKEPIIDWLEELAK